MLERLATFSEKYEFEDEFVEHVWMQDMMHFCLVSSLSRSPLMFAACRPLRYSQCNRHCYASAGPSKS